MEINYYVNSVCIEAHHQTNINNNTQLSGERERENQLTSNSNTNSNNTITTTTTTIGNNTYRTVISSNTINCVLFIVIRHITLEIHIKLDLFISLLFNNTKHKRNGYLLL